MYEFIITFYEYITLNFLNACIPMYYKLYLRFASNNYYNYTTLKRKLQFYNVVLNKRQTHARTSQTPSKSKSKVYMFYYHPYLYSTYYNSNMYKSTQEPKQWSEMQTHIREALKRTKTCSSEQKDMRH